MPTPTSRAEASRPRRFPRPPMNWPDSRSKTSRMKTFRLAFTGQDSTGLRIIGLLDFPVLKTSLLPAGISLSWQTNVGGFNAETTTDPAAPMWTPMADGPTVTNGMNVLTPPLTPESQFYRL